MRHLDEGTIHGWLDGALGLDEARRVEEHVASCERCTATVAEARGLVAASSRILGALDSGADGRIAGQMGGRADGRRGGANGRMGGWAAGWRLGQRHVRAAAAIVFVAAGTVAVVRVTSRQERAEYTAAQAAATSDTAQGGQATAPAGAPRSEVADEVGVPATRVPEPARAPERMVAARRAAVPTASIRRKDAAGSAREGAESARQATNAAVLAERRAAADQDAMAPALEIEGLTLVSDSMMRQNGRAIRLSVYKVRPGVVVMLEVAGAPGVADTLSGAARGRGGHVMPPRVTAVQVDTVQAESAPAAAALALRDAKADALQSIRWVDAVGTEFTLSGPLSRTELEVIRRRIR